MVTVSANNALVTTIADLGDHLGRRLGPTRWRSVTQEEVDRFADLTDDHNFIHVDQVRASESPFGGTIAHGFLTLSLVGSISQQLIVVSDAATSINYGLNRVRFQRLSGLAPNFAARARSSRCSRWTAVFR